MQDKKFQKRINIKISVNSMVHNYIVVFNSALQVLFSKQIIYFFLNVFVHSGYQEFSYVP